jgi:23S rRNA (uracil1939-C5)-methyltransferase
VSAGGDPARVRITGIAAGGAGVGRLPDGRAVFVQRTAPGDLAEVSVLEARPRWARARLVRLVEAAPGRRAAPCPLYERCGGCTLEHLEYPAQLAAKATLVADAIRRIGGAATAEPEVVASPDEFRYRNRVSFTLLRLGGGRVVAGFHELDAPGRILDVSGACLLPERALADCWDALRRSWGAAAQRLPAGARLRLTLRATADGAATLLVEGGRGRGQPEALLAAVDRLAAIWHRPRPDRTPRLLGGEGRVPELWGDAALGLSGALFLQVNRRAAARLEAHVLALAGEVDGARIVDAYCGVGVHARSLAAAGAQVTGIELDRHAVAEARRGAPAGARFVEGAVAALLPAALPCDLVVLNPPRSGVEAGVTAALRDAPPGRIIYVSCDPATLARDISRLAPTFDLRSLRSFDLFPQTSHVETVAELACATS